MRDGAERVPALLPALAALAGVLAFTASTPIEYITGIGAAIAALYLYGPDRQSVAVFSATFFLLFVITASLSPEKAGDVDNPHLFGATVERVETGSRSCKAVVTVTSTDRKETPPFRVALLVSDINPQMRAGDILEISTVLQPVNRYKSIDYMRMADLSNKAERISATATVRPSEIGIVGHSAALRFRFDRIRESISEAINASSLPPRAAWLLEASTLGGSGLDSSTRDDFRLAGISHLLCVSGFHVGVLAALVMALLFPLDLLRNGRNTRRAVTLLCVWIYAAATGFAPSVIRAGVMISSYFLAKAFYRNGGPLNSLCLAFVVVLAINPYWLYSAGFQLSFAAVAALLLLSRKLNPVPERKVVFHKLAGLFIAPLTAMLGTLPVMLAWFHRIPLLSIIGNAVAVAVFPLFMLSGAAVVLLDTVGLSMPLLTASVSALYDFICAGTTALATVNDSISPWFVAGTFTIVALTLAVAALTIVVHTSLLRHRLVAAAACILCVLTAGCVPLAETDSAVFDSTGTGTRLHVVDRGKACTMILEGKHAGTAFSHYFAASGHFGDDVRTFDGDFAYGRLARKGNILKTGTFTIAVCKRRDSIPAGVRYALICANYRGDTDVLAGHKSLETVILSASLDTRQRLRWHRACAEAGIACIDLRQKAFGISLEN